MQRSSSKFVFLSQLKESYPHLPNDCILLVKHLVNSESLSQSPLTLLPASFQDKVKVGVQALPRNLIADRARKEQLGL